MPKMKITPPKFFCSSENVVRSFVPGSKEKGKAIFQNISACIKKGSMIASYGPTCIGSFQISFSESL